MQPPCFEKDVFHVMWNREMVSDIITYVAVFKSWQWHHLLDTELIAGVCSLIEKVQQTSASQM